MIFSPRRSALALSLSLAVAFCLPLCADDSFKEVESRVSEFTLKNGMKFIVFERHQAPVVSFYTYADVGSAQEHVGITGLAHMFEHMAFKGSTRVGGKNYAEEKLSLDRVDDTFRAFQKERDKGRTADPAKLKQLEDQFKAAQETAGKFIEPNEFGQTISKAGGHGLNASTSADKTDYFYSLPSNSTELWFYLESERFREPVFREFYKERNVVSEERRMRTESAPIGKLVEEFLAIAYKAHPYGQPTVGHMSDLDNFTRKDAMDFFKTYYQPSNLTAVIVGDVDPKEAKRFAQMYFEPIPSGPKPEPVRTIEPPQEFERRVTVRLAAQRVLIVGYHKPDINDPDNAVYETLGSLLSEGRSSRLHTALVQNKKLAVNAFGGPGFPGQKYPNLFLFGAFTAPGKTNEELEKAMMQEIERLKNEPVSPEELEGVKTRARVGVINLLKENSPMAGELAQWQVLTGDWRNMFRYLDKLNAVTPADIQRVAKKTFTPGNRTIGVIEPLETAEAK
jgi:predicted Zn-dependent peptidase